MSNTRILMLLLAGFIPLGAFAGNLGELSLSALEQRVKAIDNELSGLAKYSLRTGVGANGYRSKAYNTSDNPEWVQVNLQQEALVDMVVLVPTLWRDSEKGFRAEGFPLDFRIVAGMAGDEQGETVAAFTEQNGLLPRIAPVAVPIPETQADWVRIEANRLSTRGGDDKFVLQFSELMVFSGARNQALGCPVSATREDVGHWSNWGKPYLTDGFVPYLMDAASGRKSVAFLARAELSTRPVFTIDLEAVHEISHIHLHALDQGDTAPQAFASDFGIPRKLVIEGATRSDFSDAHLLTEYQCRSLYDCGPIMMQRTSPTPCRFVRLTATDPYLHDTGTHMQNRIAFAEIEVFSEAGNLALGKPVKADFRRLTSRPLSHITDGCNCYGNILPVRDWMVQLARRHDLENERPLVAAELNRHYLRQKANLRRMVWLATLLTLGGVIIILVDRMIRQRAILRMREQIAADLHDELGANIHAIGLLGDLARSAKTSPRKRDAFLQRMRALTERTGAAARYCTNLLEAEGLYEDLVADMRRAATRIMADIDYELSFEGEEHLARIKPRKRIDLFLFYKECLINIIRHSGATRADIRLLADDKELRLVIRDNGHGLDGSIPPSLIRRARLLGAQARFEKSDSSGTCIALTLKRKPLGGLL